MTRNIKLSKIILFLLVFVLLITSMFSIFLKRDDIVADNWKELNDKLNEQIGQLIKIEKLNIKDSSQEDSILIKYYLDREINDSDEFYLTKQTSEFIYKIENNRDIYIWYEIYLDNRLIKLYEPTSYTYWNITRY